MRSWTSEGFPTYSFIKTGNVAVWFKHTIINHPVLCNIFSQDHSNVSYLFGPRILQKCYLYIRFFLPKQSRRKDPFCNTGLDFSGFFGGKTSML